MRGRSAVAIDLSDEERAFLEAQLRRHKAARSLSDRCRIVLRCAAGLSNKEVATELGHSEHTVGKWRRRFAEHRIEIMFGGLAGPTPCRDTMSQRPKVFLSAIVLS